MNEKFYTPKQVATILQIHQYTVLKWIREGKLKALKFGRVYRTRESDLQTFLGYAAHEVAEAGTESATTEQEIRVQDAIQTHEEVKKTPPLPISTETVYRLPVGT